MAGAQRAEGEVKRNPACAGWGFPHEGFPQELESDDTIRLKVDKIEPGEMVLWLKRLLLL